MQFIDHVSEIADRFDGFIVDQWGVLHDGAAPYAGAIEALEALRAAGKRIVLLSNSGRRATTNQERLGQLGFESNLFDGIVTSGEAAWLGLRHGKLAPFDRIGRRCYFVTNGGDLGPIEGLDLEPVDDIETADFIYFTYLQSSLDEVATFDPFLHRSRERGLPFLCSNPDKIAVTASGLTAAPGSVADRYARMGGEVVYVGKPHRPIYEACLEILHDLDQARIVCIGDSTEHDIKGANTMGLTACLVRAGIHRERLADETTLGTELGALCSEHDCTADLVIEHFRW